MRRLTLTGLAVLGVLGFLTTGRASAQYYQGSYGSYGRSRPALSPYLDLTRGGNPAANYFLGTLPEIDRRKTKVEQGTAINELERRTDTLGAQLQADKDLYDLTGGGLPPTGHAATFGNMSTYFGLPTPTAPPRSQQAQGRGR
jgi:hypothetical protein